MTAAAIHPVQSHSGCSKGVHWRDNAHQECPDLRWPPAVRLMTLVAGSAVAWAVVILLSSLLFG